MDIKVYYFTKLMTIGRARLWFTLLRPYREVCEKCKERAWAPRSRANEVEVVF